MVAGTVSTLAETASHCRVLIWHEKNNSKTTGSGSVSEKCETIVPVVMTKSVCGA